MNKRAKTNLLVLAALIAPLLLVVLLAWGGVASFQSARPGAPVTYALDDAYIHMAMARSLAQHGVFGITPYEFTSSSSSLLWALLLALVYRVFGASLEAPLALNLLFAGLSVWAAWRILRRPLRERPGLLLGSTLAVALFTPLVPLALAGMEAAMQVALALLFAAEAAEQVAAPRAPGWRLVVLGGLFTTARYEGLLFVGIAVLALLARRRFRLALALSTAALAPLVIFGMISLANGWSFLPNSVLMKSAGGAKIWGLSLQALSDRLSALWTQPHLLVLSLGAMGGLLLPETPGAAEDERFARVLAGFFLALLLAHVLLDHFGFFYRYEAYVIALGVTAAGSLWLPRIAPWGGLNAGPMLRAMAAGAIVFIAAMPLYLRGVTALREAPLGMANIYDQQVQMGLFLHRYYAESCVAVNDIGAVAYFGDVYVVDLAGLSTRETARAHLSGQPLRPVFERLSLAKQVRVAILYDSWLGQYAPAAWVPVGAWTIGGERVTAGGPTVTFYAASSVEADLLRKNLEEFSGSLPLAVKSTVPVK